MTIRISFSDNTVRVAVELNGEIESLTTELPQRQWVGLTNDEIKRIGKLDLDSDYFGLWYDFAKAIEAKLKEKNK